MTTTNGVSLASPDEMRRWHFDWVLPALFSPRRTFERIASAGQSIWRTTNLNLLLVTLGRVWVTGNLNKAAADSGQINYPQGFEFYTPEQQAQFQQAVTGMNTPTFHYILPAILGIVLVLGTWLLIGWLLLLALTLRGGRGSSQQMLNVASWAILPFAVREGVRIVVMMNTDRLIVNRGLSGFGPADGSTWGIFATAVLSFLDIYLLWSIALLAIGAQRVEKLPARKTWVTVILTMLLLLALRALPAVIAAQFQDLTVIRPFF
jgi:hypothetical protein